MLKLVPTLFEINERVVLNGFYKHSKLQSFFPLSYVAVGATNVGSVALEFDPVLKTNVKHVEGERTLRVFDI
jgi:phosphatidylserine decarboxylase